VPAGVFSAGDVNAGLLIKPPIGKSEVIGHLTRLLQDDDRTRSVNVRVRRVMDVSRRNAARRPDGIRRRGSWSRHWLCYATSIPRGPGTTC
jgi:hypothetical protein